MTSVRFFNSGFCRQGNAMSGGKGWKWRRYYAVFLLVSHPVKGSFLVDTGYSQDFFDATRWGMVPPSVVVLLGQIAGTLFSDPDTDRIPDFEFDRDWPIGCAASSSKHKFTVRPIARVR